MDRKPRFIAVDGEVQAAWTDSYPTEVLDLGSQKLAESFADHCNKWGNNGWPDRRIEDRRKLAQDPGVERYYTVLGVLGYTAIHDRTRKKPLGTEKPAEFCAEQANKICNALNAAELADPNGWRVRSGETERRGQEETPADEARMKWAKTLEENDKRFVRKPSAPDYDATLVKLLDQIDIARSERSKDGFMSNFLNITILADAMRAALKRSSNG